MKHLFSISTVLLLALVVLASCSRKSDSFLSRNYHAVNTEFNTLYNGNLALQEGLEGIRTNFVDNYWDILPVEPLAFSEEIKIANPDESDPNFARAEEKAIKAVQKHTMLIDGEERNPQIDEAYMLLGKARYYDQRYVEAIEAFNYVLQFMPDADKSKRARIWREKTNMRLDNNEIAIENLQELVALKDSIEFDKEDLILANATLGQAYLNVNKIDSAIIYMNRAADRTKDRATEGRYKFITGQLFARAGMRDSAIVHFDEVIDLHRKIPRDYYVQAFIEKIKLRDTLEMSDAQLFYLLNDLEQNRENRPWLDLIYSRKAIFYEGIDSVDAAVVAYNQSLREPNRDSYLRANNYSALGAISFNQARFEQAGRYYDSAVALYADRSREKRATTKKRDNLSDIILFESNRRSADSLLAVLAMSDIEREAYYNEYIETIKERDRQLAEQAAIEEANLAQQQTALSTIPANVPGGRNLGPPANTVDDIGSRGQGSFYFYVPTTVARGKLEFRSRWGNRTLEENWRLDSQRSALQENEDSDIADASSSETPPEYLASYYMQQLPQGDVALDSIADARDFAYYQLGVLYKEKFKRSDLAIDRFETLLTFEPEQKLYLPTLYNLYLLGVDNAGGDYAFAKAEQYKNTIISRYPDSRYAQILLNPQTQLDRTGSPESVYADLYRKYENEQFAQVIEEANEKIISYSGDPIVPKLELLKTYASGRLYGLKAYKEGLDFIALNYPGTEEAEKAAELSASAERLRIPDTFLPEDRLENFKVLFEIPAGDSNLRQDIAVKMVEEFKSIGNGITFSIDVYTAETSLVVLHNFKDKENAAELAEYLATPNRISSLPQEFTVIATDNYKIVQVYKSLNDYQQQTP
ncbi:type IX secretion system periplasmic lipoprotein PorW/SprE [Nonlabens ponticola]|uniref:Tetratricopeptide repeat protein n=1 Tax=Nonlabens ponticola TaxID=2496866 RepID=A0A3S9MVI3_9FLAO|nr:hypothetical protein [Nonlabens ponticola]AZQ43208.1 hypothetical protein EJ995_02770 [Nonlabens ponticola]